MKLRELLPFSVGSMLLIICYAAHADGSAGLLIGGALQGLGNAMQQNLEIQQQLLMQQQQEQNKEIEHQRQVAANEAKKKAEEEEKRNSFSTGSGFFIAPNGYLVTNAHVVNEYENIAIKDQGGRLLKATVIAIDKVRDLALLKVVGKYSPLRIDQTGQVSKGQRVLAIGYPQPTIQGSESKVTDGVISSFTGLKNDDNWFQISVPIQGGNSGGPLINEDGIVIGVVVATVNAQKFLSLTGNIPQNVNYAIKSKVLLDFLAEQHITYFGNTHKKTSIASVDSATVMVIAKHGVILDGSESSPAVPAPINKKAEDAKLDRMQPHWRKTVRSDNFKNWLKATTGAETSFDTNIASERAEILDRYKEYLAAQIAEKKRVVAEKNNAAMVFEELKKPAAQGDAEAQHKLGNAYERGDGVPKDMVKSIEWWLKAATQGYAKSQYSLGFVYWSGEGVVRDPVRAYVWFSLAAKQGIEDAKAKRDLSGVSLTSDQLIEGQHLVSEWKKGDNLLAGEDKSLKAQDAAPSNTSDSTSVQIPILMGHVTSINQQYGFFIFTLDDAATHIGNTNLVMFLNGNKVTATAEKRVGKDVSASIAPSSFGMLKVGDSVFTYH